MVAQNMMQWCWTIENEDRKVLFKINFQNYWFSFTTCTELPSNINTMGLLVNPIRTEVGGLWNPPPYGFLPFTQKIFRQPIPEISWLPYFWLRIPLWIFSLSKNLVYSLFHHFWDTLYIFCFNDKKNYLQTLVVIFFRFH